MYGSAPTLRSMGNRPTVPVRIHELARKSGMDLHKHWKCLAPGRCLEYGIRMCLQGIGVVEENGRVSKELLFRQWNQDLSDDTVKIARAIIRIEETVVDDLLTKETITTDTFDMDALGGL